MKVSRLLLTCPLLVASIIGVLFGCDSIRDHDPLAPGLYATLSNGGTRAVYVLEPSTRRHILSNAQNFSVSLRRQQILFARAGRTTAGGTLHLFDAVTGSTQSLGNVLGLPKRPYFGDDLFGYDPRWAPSGQQISFYACPRCESGEPGHLVVYDFNRAQADTVALLPGRRYNEHSWSPSGRWLAVSTAVFEGRQWKEGIDLFATASLQFVRRIERPTPFVFGWSLDDHIVVKAGNRVLVWLTTEGGEVLRREVALPIGASLAAPLIFGSARSILGASYLDDRGGARYLLLDYSSETGAVQALAESDLAFYADLAE